MTPLWGGMANSHDILRAAQHQHLSFTGLAAELDRQADVMESWYDQSRVQAARCDALQQRCSALQVQMLDCYASGAVPGHPLPSCSRTLRNKHRRCRSLSPTMCAAGDAAAMDGAQEAAGRQPELDVPNGVQVLL